VYYKGKWCTAGGKDPLFGHVDGFQIDPKKVLIFVTDSDKIDKIFEYTR